MHTLSLIELHLNYSNSVDVTIFHRKQSYCVEDLANIIYYCYSWERECGFDLKWNTLYFWFNMRIATLFFYTKFAWLDMYYQPLQFWYSLNIFRDIHRSLNKVNPYITQLVINERKSKNSVQFNHKYSVIETNFRKLYFT